VIVTLIDSPGTTTDEDTVNCVPDCARGVLRLATVRSAAMLTTRR
jgi:hypothetical protein